MRYVPGMSAPLLRTRAGYKDAEIINQCRGLVLAEINVK
jgi:hypothetical protein